MSEAKSSEGYAASTFDVMLNLLGPRSLLLVLCSKGARVEVGVWVRRSICTSLPIPGPSGSMPPAPTGRALQRALSRRDGFDHQNRLPPPRTSTSPRLIPETATLDQIGDELECRKRQRRGFRSLSHRVWDAQLNKRVNQIILIRQDVQQKLRQLPLLLFHWCSEDG